MLCQNRIKAYEESENDNEEVPQINIFDAINFTSKAWEQVTAGTIRNSWMKTMIVNNNQGSTDIVENSNDQSELIEMNDLINQLPFRNHLDAGEFINIDQNLAVQEEMTEQEIVNIVKGQSENEDEDDTMNKPEPTITSTEAIKGLETALKYVQQRNLEIDFQVIRNVNKLKREISYKISQERVQTRIEEYYMIE